MDAPKAFRRASGIIFDLAHQDALVHNPADVTGYRRELRRFRSYLRSKASAVSVTTGISRTAT